MTPKEIEAFKNRIKNYNFHIEQINKLYDEENKLWYELSFVKGASFEERTATTNPDAKNEKVLKYYDEIDEIKTKRDEHRLEISKLDTMLSKMPDEGREILCYIYLRGHSYGKAAKHFYASKGTICKKINRVLMETEYI